jgi:anti-sigma B factor antagonist
MTIGTDFELKEPINEVYMEDLMSKANTMITVRKATDSACILDIQGEVTAFSENALMDAYTQASTDGVRSVVLNFDGLEYMNSSGIGLLVTLLIRAKRQGQRLLAFGLSEHYQHIFELTRLDDAIPICEGESQALAAVQ